MSKSRAVNQPALFIAVCSTLLLSLVGFTPTTRSATVTYQYQSTISMVPFGGSTSEPYSFTFSFDDTALPFANGTNWVEFPLLSSIITIGADTATSTGGYIEITSSIEGYEFVRIVVWSGGSAPTGGAIFNGSIAGYSDLAVAMEFGGQNLFPDLLIPASLIQVFADSTFAQHSIARIDPYVQSYAYVKSSGVTVRDYSMVTPQVPLPAALPLFAAGLGAMGFMGWRKKRKATKFPTCDVCS